MDFFDTLRWYYSAVASHVENFPYGWLGVLSASAVVYITYRLSCFVHYKIRVEETKRKIRIRQATRCKEVQQIREMIKEKQDSFDERIPDLKFKDLQQRLQTGHLSARAVLFAFQRRALEVHDKTNCVTEFLDTAQPRAEYLDTVDADDRRPLHGIPISLKEAVGLEDRDCTTGFACSLGYCVEKNSALVKVLLSQGAVPFVRTNLPQGQMSIECSNPIFGMTNNPKNVKRSPGGSSGGEASLIGGGGSVLGVGCDMGGSIRVPCHCCGITGIKCTTHRLSHAGNYPFGFGIQSLSEVYSPMAQDVDALVEFLKATLVPRLYEMDPILPRVPWNNQLFESREPMTIGYYTFDGAVECVPAVIRAVELAKTRLQASGHKLVEVKPPNALYMFEHFFMSIICGDKGKSILDKMRHDVVDPCVKDLVTSLEYPLPHFIKQLLTKVPKTHPLTKIAIGFKPPGDVSEWWERNEELEEYKRDFGKWMLSEGISAIICPTMPTAALPSMEVKHALSLITYCSFYNVLGYPAGVVPTTTVTPEDIEAMKDYPNKTDVHDFIHQVTKDSEDLPIGVQCVGLPFQEELVLRLMKDLEDALKQDNEPPAYLVPNDLDEDKPPVFHDFNGFNGHNGAESPPSSESGSKESISDETRYAA